MLEMKNSYTCTILSDTWKDGLRTSADAELSLSKPVIEENLPLVKSLTTLAAFPHIGSGGR